MGGILRKGHTAQASSKQTGLELVKKLAMPGLTHNPNGGNTHAEACNSRSHGDKRLKTADKMASETKQEC